MRSWREVPERGVARVLESIVGAAVALSQPGRALRLAGAAAALRESLGVPLSPIEQAKLKLSLEPAWKSLGKLGGGAVWTEGQTMPLQRAIEYALTLRTARIKQWE